MRALAEVAYVRSAAAALVLVVLAGCTSTPSAVAPERASRTAPATPRTDAATPREVRRAEVATSERRATSEPVASEGVAAGDRRRRDYPEIETSETGFTITEQVRISGDVRADYDRALTLLEQERYGEGITILRTVTERAPDVTAPFIDLGIAYARSGDLEHAEEALRTASELAPDHPIVYNELGILYRKAGRFKEARASYERALAIYPGFHFANRNLAVLCDLYLADPDCALEHYEAYMQSVVEDPEVTIWMTDLRRRLGF